MFQEDYDLFLNAQIEGEIPSVIFFKQRLATYLRSDMEAEDDNSEARDIVTVERELAYARRCNQFQRDNMELQQACNQRRDQAAYIYQQERIQVEPSAPPMPDDDGQVNNIYMNMYIILIHILVIVIGTIISICLQPIRQLYVPLLPIRYAEQFSNASADKPDVR